MSRFDDRLTSAFDEIAEQATPNSTAHAEFRSRAAQYDQQQPREVVTMLTPTDTPTRRPRWVVPAALPKNSATTYSRPTRPIHHTSRNCT